MWCEHKQKLVVMSCNKNVHLWNQKVAAIGTVSCTISDVIVQD